MEGRRGASAGGGDGHWLSCVVRVGCQVVHMFRVTYTSLKTIYVLKTKGTMRKRCEQVSRLPGEPWFSRSPLSLCSRLLQWGLLHGLWLGSLAGEGGGNFRSLKSIQAENLTTTFTSSI